jgi:adenosylmethionine-8-amino-7-oxononanoate aminotransferase
MSTLTSHTDSLARSQEAEELDVKRTEGVYFIDNNGRQYLDFMSGWCVGNLGWAHEKVRRAVREYNGPDYVPPGFIYRPWDELAEMLADIAPGKLSKCFRTTGGSESVDTAMQIAMAYTGRKKFVSIEDSYHGNSIGPLSIGATESKDELGGLLPGCLKIETPLDEKAAGKLETRLKTKEIAAFIMEPVVLNAGVHIPTKEFVHEARRLCDKYGTLFIADEVASGFGRTGKMFAIEHYDVAPDVLCLAKALTSGYAGMGTTITTDKIFRKVKDQVNIYSTYGWHPLAVAAATATLKVFRSSGERIFRHVSEASQHFRTSLSQMEFRKGGEMSIIGLAIGVDVKKRGYVENIKERCLEEGLIISNQEKKLVMFPPLNISIQEIDEGLDILKRCI